MCQRMDKLPLELYNVIFRYLRLRDVLKLRLLSKAMNTAVRDGFRIDELIFNEHNLLYFHKLRDRWLFTTRSINYKNSLDCLNASFLNESSINFWNLKRLRIANVPGAFRISLKHLNELSRLIQLEIHYNKCEVDDQLRLPNLRVLSLRSRVQMHMRIDTINLKYLNLDYDTFEHVQFYYADKVTHLSINNHDWNVSRFSNLEHYEFNTANSLDENILRVLPKLSRLQINCQCSNYFELLNNILERSRNRGEERLQIYFKGVRWSSDRAMNERVFAHDLSRMSLQMNNYSYLLDHLPWEYSINYTELINLVNRIPSSYFRKFNSIQVIEVTEAVENQNDLIEFIKNCRNLFDLSLYRTRLPKSFYDKLAEISTLVILRIVEDQSVDLTFASRMEYLEYLIILLNTSQLDLRNLKGLEHLANIKYFKIRENSSEIEFRKLTTRRNEIKIDNRRLKPNIDLSDIVYNQFNLPLTSYDLPI